MMYTKTRSIHIFGERVEKRRSNAYMLRAITINCELTVMRVVHVVHGNANNPKLFF